MHAFGDANKFPVAKVLEVSGLKANLIAKFNSLQWFGKQTLHQNFDCRIVCAIRLLTNEAHSFECQHEKFIENWKEVKKIESFKGWHVLIGSFRELF